MWRDLNMTNKKLIKPTDAEDAEITAAAMDDSDVIPYTDSEWARVRSQVRRGPGRPLGSGTKAQVTLRLDLKVIETLKSTGPGWQTRANEVLLNWTHLQN